MLKDIGFSTLSLNRCVVRKNVVFNELSFYKDVLIFSTSPTYTSTEIEVEFDAVLPSYYINHEKEVEVSTKPILTDIEIDKTDTSNDDGIMEAIDNRLGSPFKLNYLLAKDRDNRKINPPKRYLYSLPYFSSIDKKDLITYVLSATFNIDGTKPKKIYDVINSSDSSNSQKLSTMKSFL